MAFLYLGIHTNCDQHEEKQDSPQVRHGQLGEGLGVRHKHQAGSCFTKFKKRVHKWHCCLCHFPIKNSEIFLFSFRFLFKTFVGILDAKLIVIIHLIQQYRYDRQQIHFHIIHLIYVRIIWYIFFKWWETWASLKKRSSSYDVHTYPRPILKFLPRLSPRFWP